MKLPYKAILLTMLAAIALPAQLSISACTPRTGQYKTEGETGASPLTFSIGHVGDTHAYVEPYDYVLKPNGRDVKMVIGGYSLLAASVADQRAREKNVLLLHAGDIMEGTIWTPSFGGLADSDCLNLIKFDAVVLGNHDFARGTAEAAAMVNSLKVPVLAANLNAEAEPSLKGRIQPFRIVEIEQQKVGIIGLITPDTAWMSRPGNNIVFLDPYDTARRFISQLDKQGVNKIIILSHLGYEEDARLARSVAGIDVIIGGHSHTFMGGPGFKLLGLNPQMQYPVELSGPAGDRVLIAHAWENNRLKGELQVTFDGKGRIEKYKGQPYIYGTDQFSVQDHWGWMHLCSCNAEWGKIMQATRDSASYGVVTESSEVDTALETYRNGLPQDRSTSIAKADESLYRGINKGPGPIVADAFLKRAQKANPAVKFAIYASCDIRADIDLGDVSTEKLWTLLPMRQKLATVTTSGSVIRTLIEMIYDGHIKAGVPAPYMETSGLRMTVDLARRNGERITSLQVRDKEGAYQDMLPDTEYTFVTADRQVESAAREVVSRLPIPAAARERAAGWILTYLKFNNTGVKDMDAITDYCSTQKNLKNVTEERTTIIRSAETGQ